MQSGFAVQTVHCKWVLHLIFKVFFARYCKLTYKGVKDQWRWLQQRQTSACWGLPDNLRLFCPSVSGDGWGGKAPGYREGGCDPLCGWRMGWGQCQVQVWVLFWVNHSPCTAPCPGARVGSAPCARPDVFLSVPGIFPVAVRWGSTPRFTEEEETSHKGSRGLPRWLSIKDPPASRNCRRLGFDPWVTEIPWRREWQPTPVFLPGESHGQKSLAGTVHRRQRFRHDWSDLACMDAQRS